MDRTDKAAEWLPEIAEAGLTGDLSRLQLVLLSAVRSLRKDTPNVSARLGELLAQYSTGTNPLRSQGESSPPPPTESEEGMSLVRLVRTSGATSPVLDPKSREVVDQFITERRSGSSLIKEGFAPPCSLLLTGAPGTGKTMLARWLANELELPLVVQDLSTSISSLLGKTGFNLRRTLDYARSHPCILLLDEFDAIAKRRDDANELGELKRIVNVLLKELEDWPLQSVLVAATNHPELLDPAINRRFDLALNLCTPGDTERVKILSNAAGRFVEELPGSVLDACSMLLAGRSGSDIVRTVQSSIRRHLSRNVPLAEALVHETIAVSGSDSDKRALGTLIRAMHKASKGELTVREIGAMVGKSASTVQHHLKKKEMADG